MPRRKPKTQEGAQSDPVQEAAPSEDAAPPMDDMPSAERPPRQFRANPFPIKTVNLEGYKVRLQESRPAGQPWQMQIKFGDGSREQMPSDEVRDFIKSHKITIETMEGSKEVNLFRWNGEERAWAMRIEFNAPATSRLKAEGVFKEAVKRVAEERGISREI